MRTLFAAVVSVSLGLLSPAQAPAQAQAEEDEEILRPLNSALRLGLVMGEPIGATALIPILEQLTLNLEAGSSNAKDTTFIASADVVFWWPEVFGALGGSGNIAPWFGAGARFAFGKDRAANHFGVRVPFGISFLAPNPTVEVFVEVAPGLGFGERREASLDGAIGVRVGL